MPKAFDKGKGRIEKEHAQLLQSNQRSIAHHKMEIDAKKEGWTLRSKPAARWPADKVVRCAWYMIITQWPLTTEGT